MTPLKYDGDRSYLWGKAGKPKRVVVGENGPELFIPDLPTSVSRPFLRPALDEAIRKLTNEASRRFVSVEDHGVMVWPGAAIAADTSDGYSVYDWRSRMHPIFSTEALADARNREKQSFVPIVIRFTKLDEDGTPGESVKFEAIENPQFTEGDVVDVSRNGHSASYRVVSVGAGTILVRKVV